MKLRDLINRGRDRDERYIVTTYTLMDDTLKAIGFADDQRARLSAAEILTVGGDAAGYFQNHQERAVEMMVGLGYIARMSLARFNRR